MILCKRAVARWLVTLILGVTMNGSALATQPLIIDTDVGVDDVIAILYLLKSPDISIKAITIACDGNAHCKPALNNTLGLLQLMHKTHIPVASGQTKPLRGNHRFPENLLDESDTLAGTANLLPRTKPNTTLNAVDLLINTLHKSDKPIDILAIGPLTNIAQALQTSPKIKNKIRTLYIMGGAIHVPGNIHHVDPMKANTTAEWNFYLDPLAANIVLQEDIRIILVPLDLTQQLPIDMAFYHSLEKNHASIAANYVYTLLKNNLTLVKQHQWFFWDPLAAVLATDESMATYKSERLNVRLTPEAESGRTVVSHDGKKILVPVTVDQAKIKAMLLNQLNQ